MSAENLVEYVAKNLAARPEAVRVRLMRGAYTHLIELEVAPEDAGKIIGKGGRTIQALRTLAASASRDGKKTVLELIE